MRSIDLPILESTLVDAEYQVGWPVHADELPSPGDRVVIVEHRPRLDVWNADRVAWQRELAARVRHADRTPGRPLTIDDYPQLQSPKPKRPSTPRPKPTPSPVAIQPTPPPQPDASLLRDRCGAEGCAKTAGWRVTNKAEGLGWQWFLACPRHIRDAKTVWPDSEVVELHD